MTVLKPVGQYRTPKRLWLVLSLFATLATISSIVVPPFETPDEIWHFGFMQHVATTGTLPRTKIQEDAPWRQQGAQTPGYYLAAAALTSWIDQSDFPALYAERPNPHVAIGIPGTSSNVNAYVHYPEDGWPWQGSFLALHVARFFSVLLGAVTLWATYQTIWLLTGEQVALLGVTLFAFVPQFIFISGAASNDNAINAMAALLLWRLVLLLKHAPHNAAAPDPARLTRPWQSPKPYLIIGGLLGLALLAKISGLWLLLVTGVALGMVAYRTRSWRVLGQGGVLVGGVALLLAGWWFWRNWQLYGNWLALNIWRGNIDTRPQLATWQTIINESESLNRSFWGIFGWFNIAYPAWVYHLLVAVEWLVVAGLLLWGARQLQRLHSNTSSPWESWRWQGIVLLGLWLLALTTSWLAFMRWAPAAQGRYFHPAAPILALGMAIGLRAWRLHRAHPPFLAWSVAAGFVVLSAVTPWWTIRPMFRPSPVLAALPPDATPYVVRFGDLVQLEGYRVAHPASYEVPLEVEFYWRALRPIDRPYSISVKIWERDWKLLAADEAYPDGGRWPTTRWPTTGLVVDRRHVRLPVRHGPATIARVEVDVYDFNTMEPLPATIDGMPTRPVHPFFLTLEEQGVTPIPDFHFSVRPLVERVTVTEGAAEVRFTWQVGQGLARNYQAFFHLAPDLDQPAVAQADFTPLAGEIPTSLWWFGDRYREQAQIDLPFDLPLGDYLLLLGLYDLETGQRVEGEPGRTVWPVGTLHWDGMRWYEVQ